MLVINDLLLGILHIMSTGLKFIGVGSYLLFNFSPGNIPTTKPNHGSLVGLPVRQLHGTENTIAWEELNLIGLDFQL